MFLGSENTFPVSDLTFFLIFLENLHVFLLRIEREVLTSNLNFSRKLKNKSLKIWHRERVSRPQKYEKLKLLLKNNSLFLTDLNQLKFWRHYANF